MEVAETKQYFASGDRIFWMAVLIVACFVSVLLFDSQSVASYPTYALSLMMVITFREWRDVMRLPLMRWISALLVWLSLSVFWSDPFDWREAASVWSRALLIFFFVVAFAECQLRGQLQRWMGIALTVAGAIVVLAALVNFFVTSPADGRLNGLGQLDTHVVAALVYGVILLFVVRSAHVYHVGWVRVVAVAVALVIACAVFLSDSRNAWVSVLLGVVAYLVAVRAQDWRQFMVAVLVIGGIAIVLLLLLATNSTTQELVLPRGNSHRFTIWGATLEQILNHDAIIFGRGVLTQDNVAVQGIVFMHPHNIYLSLLHQGGLVALALYLILLVKAVFVFAGNFEGSDAKLGLSILALAMFAHLLDGHELVDKIGDTWFLVWMPIGVALGLGWRPRSDFRIRPDEVR